MKLYLDDPHIKSYRYIYISAENGHNIDRSDPIISKAFSILQIFKKLKSLSPIHFVKIRLSNFLGNEFLVKMYKL